MGHIGTKLTRFGTGATLLRDAVNVIFVSFGVTLCFIWAWFLALGLWWSAQYILS